MPTKVVINTCYGGFGVSIEAAEKLGIDYVYGNDIDREDPNLIALIEEKGSEYVSDDSARLEVVEIQEEHYTINDYDGMETIYASNSPIKQY